MTTALCSACQFARSQNITASDRLADTPMIPHEYIIGPEDVLEINVWKNADLSKTVIVRPDGMITLPLIGEVRAGGKTAGQLKEMISSRLEKYKDIPEVTVTVAQVNSYVIYVLGEVRNPGKYQVRSYTTVLQAVAQAGGFLEWAKKNGMVILRKTQNGLDQKIKVRYKDVLRDKGSKPDELLYPGDTLIVP
jgi:polysaccharide export outer membrane protein